MTYLDFCAGIQLSAFKFAVLCEQDVFCLSQVCSVGTCVERTHEHTHIFEMCLKKLVSDSFRSVYLF